ncbi:hypothetical protein OG216_29880 [Streptomycetaceae bacterium NBC_01309]
MLAIEGDFAIEGHAYETALTRFEKLGLWEEIRADERTTLTIASRKGGRQGDTTLTVGKVNTEATTWHAWCKEGVHLEPVDIRIDIVVDCGEALTLELLAHEWCLHGAKNWHFVKAMRKETKPGNVKELGIAILGTATTVTDVVEHRELAENTHEFFRTTMFTLRSRFPTLAEGLMRAWQDDISDNKASARAGKLAVPAWPDEDDGKGKRKTTAKEAEKASESDDEGPLVTTKEAADFEAWLGDNGSDDDDGATSLTSGSGSTTTTTTTTTTSTTTGTGSGDKGTRVTKPGDDDTAST